MNMNFFIPRTTFQIAKSDGADAKSHREFASVMIAAMEAACDHYGGSLREIDPFTPTLLMMEAEWAELRMPYYNLWPSIIPALTKLRLDVDASHFKLPVSPLLIRFPSTVPHPLRWSCDGQEWVVQTLLVDDQPVRMCEKLRHRHPDLPNGSDVPALSFFVDIDEPVEGNEMFRQKLYKHCLTLPGWSIERSFSEIPGHSSADSGVQYPDHIVQDLARIVCTLCLMADDPQLVVPDVLSKDKQKFAESRDSRLVAKAHNRGKVGWNVGADIEVSPHYRNASPAALYWTGQGRKVPRIRFRKGCFVHRQRMSSVPTGYLLPQGEKR